MCLVTQDWDLIMLSSQNQKFTSAILIHPAILTGVRCFHSSFGVQSENVSDTNSELSFWQMNSHNK